MGLGITISNDKPSNAIMFRRYVESGVWQCPTGGAHRWIHAFGITWRCTKCNMAREFPCPDYDYDSAMSTAMYWDSCRDLDRLARGLVY